jgi:carboxylesterase
VRKLFFCFLILSAAVSCKKKGQGPPIDNARDLDGNQINDSSLIVPENFLLSAAVRKSGVIEASKKVFICVHGFSATNFEWQEFAGYCKGKPDALVSRVLLGGHGRDYEDFKNASWKDWQAPILEEYNALRDLGFTNITLVGSSTGCPLILDLLRGNHLSEDVLKGIYFIDPIVVPSNKQLSLAPIVGGTVIQYTESGLDEGEYGYWYTYRPQEALKELNKLTKDIRKGLEKKDFKKYSQRIHVYKTERDGSADPVSAVILKEGLKNCVVTMVDSDLHVFTRLKGRPSVSDRDIELQQHAFEEIYTMQ